jgi:hypothetical protein
LFNCPTWRETLQKFATSSFLETIPQLLRCSQRLEPLYHVCVQQIWQPIPPGSVDLALHVLDWYEAEKGTVDGLLLLQPTSPFRAKETVRTGIELFKFNGLIPVLSVSPTHAHPMGTMKIQGGYVKPYMSKSGL